MLRSSWTVPTPFSQPADGVALSSAALTWWRQLPRGWRSPIWGAALALVTMLVLLVSFHQVVSGVVEQAALQRQGAPAYMDDRLRCQALPDEDARSLCRAPVKVLNSGDTAAAFGEARVVELSSR